MSFLDNISGIATSALSDIEDIPASDFNFTSVPSDFSFGNDWGSLVNAPTPPVGGLTGTISSTLNSLTQPISAFFNTELAIQQGKNAVAISKATGANQVQVAKTGNPSVYAWAIGGGALLLGIMALSKK